MYKYYVFYGASSVGSLWTNQTQSHIFFGNILLDMCCTNILELPNMLGFKLGNIGSINHNHPPSTEDRLYYPHLHGQ